MKNLLYWIIALFLLGFLGCIAKLSDHGEAGIRYGTEITFFSRASTTEATSEASVDFKPTSDFVDSLRDPEPETNPASSGPG